MLPQLDGAMADRPAMLAQGTSGMLDRGRFAFGLRFSYIYQRCLEKSGRFGNHILLIPGLASSALPMAAHLYVHARA